MSNPSMEDFLLSVAESAILKHQAKVDDYEIDTLSSDVYIGQKKLISSITADFAYAVEVASLAFTRYPHSRDWLTYRLAEELQESAISVYTLVASGIFNASQRELRYMVESAVKYVHVDQIMPGHAKISERENFLHQKVPRSSVGIIDDTTLRMVPAESFRQDVKSLFSSLSAYVHPSMQQLRERRRKVERGESLGFESADSLVKFSRTLTRVYDIVLALVFEGIGPNFSGDVFIEILDGRTRWKFRNSKYCKAVSRHFDYKLERSSNEEDGA